MTLNNLGLLLAGLGEREAARAHYEEALGIYLAFHERFPRAFIQNLLIVLNGLRRVYQGLGLEEEEQQCRARIEGLLGSAG